MEPYADKIAEIVKNNREPDWLRDLRLSALDRFQSQPQPSPADEEWRRTDVSQILYSDLEADAAAIAPQRHATPWNPASAFSGPGLSLSDATPQDSLFLSLTEAAQKYPERVRPCLEQALKADGQKFYALANAFWNGGVFLYVPKNTRLQQPLAALISPPSAAGGTGRPAFFPKVVVVMEPGSSATLLLDETFPSGWEGWTHGTLDVFLRADASLTLAQACRSGQSATAFSSVQAVLERGSGLNALGIHLGGSLNKNSWNVSLTGEGSAARLYGLVKGENREHYDQTVFVDHRSPNTASDVLFKSVLKDRSRAVFNGLIHVRKNARKTDAHQTNRNLLLSREARADTIPKLEIETDDVQCGHGAAVSSLDPDQLYYLMSRGLSRQDAETLIVDGFYEDAVGLWLDKAPADFREPALAWVRNVLFGSPQERAAESEPQWQTQK